MQDKNQFVHQTLLNFPVKYKNPKLSDGERIAILLQDLISIVGSPTRKVKGIEYGDKLNNALRKMQDLMCCNVDGLQPYDPSKAGE